MVSRCPIRLCALCLIWLGLTLPAAQAETGMRLPFQPGERLHFALRWEAIPAGEASLEVLPLDVVEGQPACHFLMTARTTPFLDTIYRVRDRIEGWTDLEVTRSLRYRKDQQEGRRRRNIVVAFDWHAQSAQYTNLDHRRDPIAILPGTFDPLSAFYFTRRAELPVGQSVQRPVTDGRRHVVGTARALRRETVTVPAGTFDTVLVEPDLKDVGGVFRKSPGARIFIWLTDDARRIPVKLQSRVVIGRFVGELVSLEGVDGRPAALAAGTSD
jgi:hypothetical protein